MKNSNLIKNGSAAVLTALLAAALYGISMPFSKMLLLKLPPTLMAALLYLGAGFGMFAVSLIQKKAAKKEAGITKKDLPYIFGMIVLDIAAPVLLMIGLTETSSSSASLLNNFEIVATSLLAFAFFKESIGKRMIAAITLVTVSGFILSVKDFGSFSFSPGSALVLAACVCWGLENNCTRMLSLKDPVRIVVIKGAGSGFGSLLISFLIKEKSGPALYIALAMLLGFVSYGLSIFFYIRAQRDLGAARTSAYYAAAPFIGVLISVLGFGERLTGSFIAALAIMVAGAYFAVTEVHSHLHAHEALTHEHKHRHDDGHHDHVHEPPVYGEHCHMHTHEAMAHTHPHTPDLHHMHKHKKPGIL
jgi:drug/metabolite transporter (DMT)-like permease